MTQSVHLVKKAQYNGTYSYDVNIIFSRNSKGAIWKIINNLKKISINFCLYHI
ncbi:hypothetical protein DOY81_005742, partial [Sarcophaga bullata]